MNTLITLAALAASFEGSQNAQVVTALRTAEAIRDNFPSFKAETIKAFPGCEAFSGNYVENIMPVSDSSSGRTYYLVDFDGANGYVLLGDGLEILGFRPSGEFDYANAHRNFNRDFLSFSSGYHPFVEAKSVSSPVPRKTILRAALPFSGPNSLDSYVSSKYGSGYTFNSKTWMGENCQKNANFSIYRENVGTGYWKDEDNCLLSALYKELERAKSVYSSKGYSAIPTQSVLVGSTSDPLYSELMAQRTADGEAKYAIHNMTVPKAYKDIRDYFIANDAYQTGPATVTKGVGCVANLASRYGLPMSASFMTDFSFETEIINGANKACERSYVWTPSGGENAGHSMNVIGYSCYQKETGWWIFKHTDKVFFTLVDDGWQGEMSAVDFTELERAGQKGTLLRTVF